MALEIVKGSTYRDQLRWESSECHFVAGELVPGAPARFNAPSHGLPDLWSGTVEGHGSFDPEFIYEFRAVNADTLEIQCLNASSFKPGNVIIRTQVPVDMTGYEARMQIRDKANGTVLLELLSSGIAGQPRIILDNVTKTITREIPASVTSSIAWKKGVFDLEMFIGDFVIKIDSDSVSVTEEITKS